MRFVVTSSPTDSPIPAYSRALAERLAERGHEVLVLFDKRKTCNGARARAMAWPSFRPVHARDARFLARLLGSFRPDCIMADYGATNIAMLTSCARRIRMRVAFGHTLRDGLEYDLGPSLKTRFLHLRKALIYRAATHVVCPSEALREDFVRNWGVPRERIAVFPHCIADPGLAPGRSNGTVFVCAGRLSRTKAQDLTIRALALLRDAEVKVEFAGDGPLRTYYEQLAAELGVTGNCTFAGQLPRLETLERMARATATLLPSRSEAFGLAAIESFGVGTPIIAARVGGLVESIPDGEVGFTVPPGDVEALALRMRQLARNPELRNRLAAAARARFLQHYEIGRVLDRNVAWLEEVLTR